MNYSRLLASNSAGETPESFATPQAAAQWALSELEHYYYGALTHIYCVSHAQWEKIEGSPRERDIRLSLTGSHTFLNITPRPPTASEMWVLTFTPCDLVCYVWAIQENVLRFSSNNGYLSDPIAFKILKRGNQL